MTTRRHSEMWGCGGQGGEYCRLWSRPCFRSVLTYSAFNQGGEKKERCWPFADSFRISQQQSTLNPHVLNIVCVPVNCEVNWNFVSGRQEGLQESVCSPKWMYTSLCTCVDPCIINQTASVVCPAVLSQGPFAPNKQTWTDSHTVLCMCCTQCGHFMDMSNSRRCAEAESVFGFFSSCDFKDNILIRDSNFTVYMDAK